MESSAPPARDEARRPLGVWRSWSLVVGGAIGSAVFMMPAVMAPYGGLGLLSLVSATLGAVCVAMTLGAMARRITVSGGMYAYTQAAFGDFAAFLVAWTTWIGMWVSCAAVAIGFVAYLGALVPAIGSSPLLGALSGVALIWVLVWINIAGVRESGIFSLLTTLLKLTPLILIIVVGLWFVRADSLPAMHPGEGNPLAVFASVFALSFWNFVGIEAATIPAEDAVDPSRTIPRALLVGTLTVGAVYVLVSFVAMGVVPSGTLASSSSPLVDVGTRVFGGFGAGLVIAGALVSTAGCLNVGILEGGMTSMAAGRDHVFPDFFARLSRRRTPWISYVLVGVLTSVLLLLNFSRGLVAAYQLIILLATLTIIIPYAFSAVACLVLRIHDSPASGRIGGHESVVAVITFAVCFWVVAASGADTAYWTLLLLMLGLPVYVVVARKKLRAGAATAAEVRPPFPGS
jgi:basic amino acid/polyamine antiporter, APA family